MSAHRTLAALVGCALAFLLGAGAASGQVSVFPVQDLSFGTLRPGVAARVAPEDAQRRAEIEVLGSGRLVLTLGLPDALVSATGHRIPLSFSNQDAMLVFRASAKSHTFNPANPTNVNVKDSEGGLSFFLGGQASPAFDTPPGAYTAKIVLQVAARGT